MRVPCCSWLMPSGPQRLFFFPIDDLPGLEYYNVEHSSMVLSFALCAFAKEKERERERKKKKVAGIDAFGL